MKLYTEEQVKKTIELARVHKPNDFITWFSNHDDDIIDSLTPIELPSDEEIEKEAIGWWAPSPFRGGVQWVIRQIKQQDI